MKHHSQHFPFVRNPKIRMIMGFILLVLSATLTGIIICEGRIEVLVLITAIAWLPSIFLTDKYVHKYPQRYFTYLIASHLKAAITMAIFLWIMSRLASPLMVPQDVLWTSFIFFVIADALVAVPSRRDIMNKQSSVDNSSDHTLAITTDRSNEAGKTKTSAFSSIDTRAILRQIRNDLEKPLVEFIENNLPELQDGKGNVLVLDAASSTDANSNPDPAGLLVSHVRFNDVRRLNQFFLFCAKRITMGGYFVGRYIPCETAVMNLKQRYPGWLYWPAFILHFLWCRVFPKIPRLNALYFWLTKGRNRVFSKVEIWGRLSFCGMTVIAESQENGEVYLIAQRVALPVKNKKPSYYPIVALEKVGLDGLIFRTHKIRTMFPFSEFLQKRIFEDHGLATTGKFKDDYRLTEYGRFLRKYWLDEIPGIFDWLHGDIKLVGMRATSPQFLNLYPRYFYDLYIQIKPGLIPPIYDESTAGFEQIVEVEYTYLKQYWDQPLRTDIRYLFRTFNDIVFRGVRSK